MVISWSRVDFCVAGCFRRSFSLARTFSWVSVRMLSWSLKKKRLKCIFIFSRERRTLVAGILKNLKTSKRKPLLVGSLSSWGRNSEM